MKFEKVFNNKKYVRKIESMGAVSYTHLAKRAESAAEDAGKVVESGTDSWNMVEGGGTINGRCV